MYKKIEDWAKEHPFWLMIIGVVMGCAFSFLPIERYAHDKGLLEGAAQTEKQWNEKFSNAVEIGRAHV